MIFMRFQRAPLQDVLDRRQARRKGRTSLTDEDQLLILWGMSRRWGTERIAELIPTSERTVTRWRVRWLSSPATIFELPLVIQVTPGVFRCEFCGETRDTKIRCMRHAMGHLVDPELAKRVPLNEVPNL